MNSVNFLPSALMESFPSFRQPTLRWASKAHVLLVGFLAFSCCRITSTDFPPATVNGLRFRGRTSNGLPVLFP